MMMMFPYGQCALVLLLILFFFLCPFVFVALPIVAGIDLAMKLMNNETCKNLDRYKESN